jgi:hypothetical protein
MHIFFLAISLLLVFAAAAIAEPDAAQDAVEPSTSSDAQPPPPSEASPTVSSLKTATTSPTETRAKSDSYFKQCLDDWDAATHMTKVEWQRTCRRIADERSKFMAEQMGK